MGEIKLPRLLAAAKEFNIGQDSLIDFLVSKGFSKDDLKPTSKLTEDMYRLLQQEFTSDKRKKSNIAKIDIPKTEVPSPNKEEDLISILHISIDPGTTPKEEIATVLAKLSYLYRKLGGKGIEYAFDHITLNKGEVI